MDTQSPSPGTAVTPGASTASNLGLHSVLPPPPRSPPPPPPAPRVEVKLPARVESSPMATTITDASKFMTAPSETDQATWTIRPRSAKAVTDDELLRVVNTAVAKGLGADAFMQAAVLLTMESFDKGATDATVFTGKAGLFPLKTLALSCKEAGVPVHKLCYYYTKPAYANRRVANQPPARYTGENIPVQYRWAAFDTFDALLDPYVLPSAIPFDTPSEADRQANEIFKKDNLASAAARNSLLGTQASITRGRLDAVTVTQLPPRIEGPST